jgi:N-methylhydantoinase A/oxoprolinase/acetone carboxylase beta subunit
MARPLRRFSVGRGLDPAKLALVAFGGAGGLHACRLADLVGIPSVIIPAEAGVLSAEGMLLMPEIYEQDLALPLPLEGSGETQILETVRNLIQQKSEKMKGECKGQGFVSLRFQGSDTEFWVPAQTGLLQSFHKRFQQRFGFTQDLGVECLRIRIRVEISPSLRQKRTKQILKDQSSRLSSSTNPIPAKGFLERTHLGVKPREGFFVILDPNTTTVVEKGWAARLHPNGCIILHKT